MNSWGFNEQTKDIIITCPPNPTYFNSQLDGQLDPTMDKSYDIVGGVLKDVQAMFPDEYVHMGGDEVFGNCWDQRPSIKEFMAANNIADYNALQVYYRNRLSPAI